MKKQLNKSAIVNELKGNSKFFPQRPKTAQINRTPKELPDAKEKTILENGIVTPRHRDTTVDTMTPPNQDDILETVRKAAKAIGKEAATHRFTVEEKQALAEIIFTFRKQGIKTSENEITRIALNYLIEDFRVGDSASILGKVLQKLNS